MLTKKIKDLTSEEMFKICTSRFLCQGCPLNIGKALDTEERVCARQIIEFHTLEKPIEIE
mgnify:CR=1 FL=1